MSNAQHRIGRFEVVGVIGSGGFGTVYLALDPSTTTGDRRVAVKVLVGRDEHTRNRLRAEAMAMARVASPHCVRVVDVVDEPGVLAIVSEFIEGASLRAVLRQQLRLSGPQSLDVLDGALVGLAAVHAAGIVHGDIKPDNILMDQRGTSRLIDFGLAEPAGASQPGEPLTGSPSYMSPERIAGGPVDGRSDIYAMAVLLFELLGGQRPYPARSSREMLAQHLHAPVPDIRSVRPDAGAALAELCMAGMQKDPARRPQTAEQFSTALRAAASQRYGPRWRTGGAAAALSGMVTAILHGAPGVAGLATSAAGNAAIAGIQAGGPSSAGSAGGQLPGHPGMAGGHLGGDTPTHPGQPPSGPGHASGHPAGHRAQDASRRPHQPDQVGNGAQQGGSGTGGGSSAGSSAGSSPQGAAGLPKPHLPGSRSIGKLLIPATHSAAAITAAVVVAVVAIAVVVVAVTHRSSRPVSATAPTSSASVVSSSGVPTSGATAGTSSSTGRSDRPASSGATSGPRSTTTTGSRSTTTTSSRGASPSSTSTGSVSTGSVSTGSAAPASVKTARPADYKFVGGYHFRTPTNNIYCELSATGALCDILGAPSYPVPAGATKNCDNLALLSPSGALRVQCGDPGNEPTKVLPEGTSLDVDGFSCGVVGGNGVRCVSSTAKKGFTLSPSVLSVYPSTDGISTTTTGTSKSTTTIGTRTGTSTIGTSPSTTTTGTATEVVQVSPLAKRGQLRPGYTVRTTDNGDFTPTCFPSLVAKSPSVYQCGTVADDTPACWPKSATTAWCMTTPDSTEIHQMTVEAMQPVASTHPDPWQVRLADGTLCTIRLGGAWDEPPAGQVWAYGCNKPNAALSAPKGAASAINTSSARWTAQLSHTGTSVPAPAPTTVTITKAWFAVNPYPGIPKASSSATGTVPNGATADDIATLLGCTNRSTITHGSAGMTSAVQCTFHGHTIAVEVFGDHPSLIAGMQSLAGAYQTDHLDPAGWWFTAGDSWIVAEDHEDESSSQESVANAVQKRIGGRVQTLAQLAGG